MTMDKENYLYFKAPFRTHFSLKEGNVLASGSEYQQYWKKLEKADLGKSIGNNAYKIEYLHNIDTETSLQFESVGEDSKTSFITSPQVIVIEPGKWFNEIFKQFYNELNHSLPDAYQNVISYKKDSCKIILFKNTIANLELILTINLSNKDISEQFISIIEKWTNSLASKITDHIYNDFIYQFIQKIYHFNEKNKFISSPNQHYGFPDINKKPENQLLFKRKVKCAFPLWVSRTLVVGKIDDDFSNLVKRWIITTRSKDEIIDQLRNKKHDEKNMVYLGWMHSLSTAGLDSRIFQDVKQALSFTQYFYAVLDSISLNLSQIIGISHKRKSINETKRYKELLEEMVFIANLNKTEFADVSQSMQRNRAFFLKDLVQKWTVDELFDNVDKKIELCKENINKIYQKAFNRSQRVAELLLFFISGFAILEFLKGLSEFFWSPDSLEEDVWGLYNLGKLFDPNTMLWFGISIFLMLFIIYTTIINKQK